MPKVRCPVCGKVLHFDTWVEFFAHFMEEQGYEYDFNRRAWVPKKEERS